MSSRIEALIQKLEGGERLTPDDLARTLDLQALDIAREGELFLEERLAAEKEADDKLQQQLEQFFGD